MYEFSKIGEHYDFEVKIFTTLHFVNAESKYMDLRKKCLAIGLREALFETGMEDDDKGCPYT